MLPLAKRYRQMIYAAIICTASVAITFVFGVNPMLDAAATANVGTDQNDALLNVEIARVNHLQLLTHNRSIVDAQLTNIMDAVPEEPHVSTMVDALNGAANANGLVVTSLNVGDPEKFLVPAAVKAQPDFQAAITKVGGTLRDIPVTLTVDGPFNALLKFMDDMQNLPRVTLVRGLEFTPAATPGNYNLQIDGYVFMTAN